MIYFLLFLGTLIEGELALTLVCYVFLKGDYNLWLALWAGSMGAFLGDSLSYVAGQHFGEPTKNRFPKIGRSISWFFHTLGRFPFLLILVLRFQIMMRTMAYFSLGRYEPNRNRTLFYLFISSWIWCAGILYILDIFIPVITMLYETITVG